MVKNVMSRMKVDGYNLRGSENGGLVVNATVYCVRVDGQKVHMTEEFLSYSYLHGEPEPRSRWVDVKSCNCKRKRFEDEAALALALRFINKKKAGKKK